MKSWSITPPELDSHMKSSKRELAGLPNLRLTLLSQDVHFHGKWFMWRVATLSGWLNSCGKRIPLTMPYDSCHVLCTERNPVLFEASPPNPGGFEGRTSSSTSLPGCQVKHKCLLCHVTPVASTIVEVVPNTAHIITTDQQIILAHMSTSIIFKIKGIRLELWCFLMLASPLHLPRAGGSYSDSRFCCHQKKRATTK